MTQIENPIYGRTTRVIKTAGLAGQGLKTPMCGLMVLSSWAFGSSLAWSQEASKLEQVDASAPNARFSYSLGAKLDIADLRQFEGFKLRPTIGVRYGRWRIGAVDSQSWTRFGQALQDNSLTYDWMKDSKWQTSLSASVINLDKDATFDAIKAGRKTLRAKASLNYNLDRRWILGLTMTQDLFNRDDGTSLSPTLTYLKPLEDGNAFLISAYTTWATANHWQSLAARDTGSAVRLDAGLGSWGAQITYRQRFSTQWAFFTQLSTSRLIEPSKPVSHVLGWGGQLGIVYFSH